MFQCSPTRSGAPPSSSPPGSMSLFVTCHVSKLTNPLLLSSSPPASESSFVSCHISKLTNLFLPSHHLVLVCHLPCSQPQLPSPPSSSPPPSDSSSVLCYLSQLTSLLLPPTTLPHV